jgi:hypothetical protein
VPTTDAVRKDAGQVSVSTGTASTFETAPPAAVTQACTDAAEYQTLVDEARSAPAFDPVFEFASATAEGWTGTPTSRRLPNCCPNYAFTFWYEEGVIGWRSAGGSRPFRCVANGP